VYSDWSESVSESIATVTINVAIDLVLPDRSGGLTVTSEPHQWTFHTVLERGPVGGWKTERSRHRPYVGSTSAVRPTYAHTRPPRVLWWGEGPRQDGPS
jgi:hypothetical protein